MKRTLRLFYPVVCCIFFSCSGEESNTTIRIICKECTGKYIQLGTASLLRSEPVEVYRSVFDSSGIAQIKLDSRDTLQLFLRVAKNEEQVVFSTPIYVEPGTTLLVDYSDGTVKFDGDLALVNSYIADIVQLNGKRHDYINTHGRNYWHVSGQEKEVYFGNISSFGKKLDQKIKADTRLSDYHKQLLLNKNLCDELTQRLYFDYQAAIAQRNSNEENGIPESGFSPMNSEYFINPCLIKNSYYLMHLEQYLGVRVSDIWDYYDENKNKIGRSRYDYIKYVISQDPKTKAFQNLILALCITNVSNWDWIDYDELSELYQAFEKDYPRSEYLSELHEILAEHGELRRGMPMKDFTMEDVNGKEFKLSDLKGKLIYMDVWATWCGPCREEMKYSVKLAKKYANRPDLTLLYVSVEEDRKSWKTFLQKNPSVKGVHGIQPSGNKPPTPNTIRELYKIRGIPRYILIDKDGNIVDRYAAPPSQLLTNHYLDSLLTL